MPRIAEPVVLDSVPVHHTGYDRSGSGQDGPTLEIFHYDTMPERPQPRADTPGFSHIAFAVDDVRAAAQAIFEAAGSAVGELTELRLPGVGRLTFQYVADPEGNMIEIQSWAKTEQEEK